MTGDYGDDWDDADDDDGGGRPLAPFVKGSATSEMAARGQRPGKVRNTIIAIIALYRTGDFTMDEALRLLDEKGDNYSGITPRFTTCRLAGILKGTGVNRRTSRGALAEVLTLVPGATIETYDAYKRGETSDVLDKSRWKKLVIKAASMCAEKPTPENRAALIEAATAGAPFIKPTKRRSAPAAAPVEDLEEPDEDINPMEWAMGR